MTGCMRLLMGCLLGALALPAAASTQGVFAATGDLGGAFRTMDGNNLSNEFNGAAGFPGVEAIAFGDVTAAVAGDEIVVARSGAIEIRSGMDYSLLDSRGGFERIYAIAIGDVTGSASPEIVIGSQTGGGGRLSVLDPLTVGLPDLTFSTLGFAVTGVAIGDVRGATAGNEIVFGWAYQVSPSTNTQVLVTNYATLPGGIVFQNITGQTNGMATGELLAGNANAEIVVGQSDGGLYVYDGDTAASPIDLLLIRAGWGEITSLAVGELVGSSAGAEVALGATVAGGTARILAGGDLSDLALRNGFVEIPSLAIGDVNDAHAGNELITGDTVSNGVRILNPEDPGLGDLLLRTGFGTMAAVGVYTSPLVPVELSGFELN